MRKYNIIIEKKIYTTVVFLLMIFFGLYETSAAGILHDVNQAGPYAVGHILYIIDDVSRLTTDYDTGEPESMPRPVPVYVFYPVDPEDINESTPKASYYLDPLKNYYDTRYLTNSEQWEAQGLDPAYQDLPASADGPFPLLMVSHGWGNHAWRLLYLGPRLASHGFTVALVYHYGDRRWGYEEPDHLAGALMNRTTDISFALTELLEINEIEGEILHNVIDPDKIAAAGYSLGAHTALALVGGDDDVCDKGPQAIPPDFECEAIPTDPRFKTVVSLDGASFFLKFNELARITVPLLSIGTDWWGAWQSFGLTVPYTFRSRLHAASQGHPSYRVDIIGTDHRAFGNGCEEVPILAENFGYSDSWIEQQQEWYCAAELPPQEVKRIITKYIIAFLKTNLSNEQGYQRILTPGHALTQENMVDFFETEKRNPHSIYEDWPEPWFPPFRIYFFDQPGSENANAYKDEE